MKRPFLVLLAAWVVVATGVPLAAQPYDPGHSPGPYLEIPPGWNCYWHDPENPGNLCPVCCGLHATAENATFYAGADFVPLMRDESGTLPFQALGSPTGIVLSTGNFEPEFECGGKGVLGCALGDCYRLETVVYSPYKWDDTAAVRNMDPITVNNVTSTGNLRSPFTRFGNPNQVVGLDFNDFAQIAFESKFQSVELNLRRRMAMPYCRSVACEASVLLGFRYIKIDDNFHYLTHSNLPTPAGTVNQVDVFATNDLYGPQGGFLSQVLLCDKTWLDAEIKGAVFQNRAEQHTSYTVTDNSGTANFLGAAARDRTAFLGDLSLTVNHQFSPTWTVRLGYNALWLTGLALGDRNFNRDVNILRLGPATIDHSGRMAYHGPTLGVVWSH